MTVRPHARNNGGKSGRRQELGQVDQAAQRETEAKFSVSASQLRTIRNASELAPGILLGPEKSEIHQDRYYDTPSFALLRAGYALRLRQVGAVHLVALKGVGRGDRHGLHSRFEAEEPISQGALPSHLEGWPPSLAGHIAKLAGEAPQWLLLCTIHQMRYKRPMWTMANQTDETEDPHPTVVGEVSLDEVAVYPPQAIVPAEGNEPALRFRELEVELADDTQEPWLRQWTREQTRQAGLKAVRQSKFERALLELVDRPPDGVSSRSGIQPEMAMTEAGRQVWRIQLMHMLLNEAGAREGSDPEYVHHMRVAVRRARTALRVFDSDFQSSALQPFRKRLRRTARLLGEVRDLDVARSHLATFGPGRDLTGEDISAKDDVSGISAVWDRQRAKATRRLLRWLDDRRYADFVTDFAAFCATPGRGVRPAKALRGQPVPPNEVRHILPGLLMADFGAIRSYDHLLFAQGKTMPYPALHQLRIELKKFRYTLETVEPLLGSQGKKLIHQCIGMQNLLGELNDAVVQKERLIRFQKGQHGECVQRYLTGQDERIQRILERFPKVWRSFISTKSHRLLAVAVARL